MEISVKKTSVKTTVLTVAGRVDAVTSPEMEKAVTGAFTEPKSCCILNLAGVDYMSSAGIRVLVLGSKTAASSGGLFMICCLQDPVKKVLEIVGLLPLLDVFTGEDKALDAASKKLGG